MRQVIKQSDKHHIAGKPVSVMRWLMSVAPPGGIVLDLFTGSGSTLVAAETGRQYIGFELDGHWTEQAQQRTSAVRMPMFEEAA